MDVLYGKSRSTNDNHGLLVEFNRMDSPETFIYDERGARLDAGDQLWLRSRRSQQLESGEGLLGAAPFPARDRQRLRGRSREFRPQDDRQLRARIRRHAARIQVQDEPGPAAVATKHINPTLAELGVTCRGSRPRLRFRRWSRSAGGFADARSSRRTSTRSARSIGFDCNCVNEYGDCRLSYLSNPGNQFARQRIRHELLHADQFRLRTVRSSHCSATSVSASADTRVVSHGLHDRTWRRPARVRSKRTHSYNDDLPSFNVAYQLTDDTCCCAAAGRR